MDREAPSVSAPGLTIPDADLLKMDWYVKGVQA